LTKDTIAQRTEEAKTKARQEVLSVAKEFNELDIKSELSGQESILKMVTGAYSGLSDGNIVGYVFSVVNKGYGGDINITVGIDMEGKITGVNIGKNNETPGLGSKATPEITDQLKDLKPVDTLKVVKGESDKAEDIQSISGATITSRAVTDAVQAAVDAASILLKEGK